MILCTIPSDSHEYKIDIPFLSKLIEKWSTPHAFALLVYLATWAFVLIYSYFSCQPPLPTWMIPVQFIFGIALIVTMIVLASSK